MVLEETFDVVEYISLHGYFSKHGDRSRDFMAEADLVGRYIDEIVAVADGVAARRRSPKRIMLSFDEWNVWYRTRDRATRTKPGWPEAPAILEEIYTMEDALVFGSALLMLINRCNRVKAACVAQLVNVIGLIMTETGGRAWRQPVFYPFQHAARWARGTVLDMRLTCGTFAAGTGEIFPISSAQPCWPRTATALRFFASTAISTRRSMSRSTFAACIQRLSRKPRHAIG